MTWGIRPSGESMGTGNEVPLPFPRRRTMSEYKRALRRTWTGWRATNEELELIRKCTVIEEARVGHEIRLNDMMHTLAMKRVHEILKGEKNNG